MIEFERQKTIRTRKSERKIQITLDKELSEIIAELGNQEKSKASYVFDVLSPDQTEKVKDNTIRQWIKTTNKWLKRYCQLIGIPEITTYWSRHTFASLAKSEVLVAMIKEMLGHSRISTTEAYLGRFADDERREGYMKITKGLAKKSA